MSNLPYLPPEIKEKIISMVDDVDIRRYFGVYNKIDKSRYRFIDYVLPIKTLNGEPAPPTVDAYGSFGGPAFSIDHNGDKYCNFTYILPNIVQRPLDNFSNLEIPNDFVCVSEYECTTLDPNKIYYEIAIWRLKNRTSGGSRQYWQLQLELGSMANTHYWERIHYKYSI